MLILVINCGSSSAKYQLFDIRKYRSLSRGIVERIGQKSATLTHHRGPGCVLKRKARCADHYAAIEMIVDALIDKKRGVIRSKADIDGIGHRVVHGGERFKEAALITEEVIRTLTAYSELAPLHNPPSLFGIRACSEILRGVPQAAVFDTAFHQTMPERAFLYGLPYRYYTRYGIRRYGFHGTSHRFVAQGAAERLKRPLSRLKLVTCHLGNGCSMTAVDGGRSVDTSMGFTPLEGLLMGTRSGDIDPAAVLYMMEKENLSLNRVNDILNKESGLLGVSGLSNDMRDIVKEARGKRPRHKDRRVRQEFWRKKAKRARLALEIFIYRIEKYIGAYMAAMGGLDAVVFTAGISEHSPWLVKRIAGDMRRVVPKRARFLVVPTNEELLIARDTHEVIKKKPARPGGIYRRARETSNQ